MLREGRGGRMWQGEDMRDGVSCGGKGDHYVGRWEMRWVSGGKETDRVKK